MKYEIEDFHRDVSAEDLISDLREVYKTAIQDGISLTFRSYNEIGKYSAATIATRFGSWNKGLVAAGLPSNESKNSDDHELFTNLEAVWTVLGRQPKTRDLIKPLSQYTHDVYRRRFGSYRRALVAFMEWAQQRDPESVSFAEDLSETTDVSEASSKLKRRTSRNISDRMRFRVLMRDGFACQSCGASPQKQRGVELHVDHVIPWSRGGETVEGNLQTKCSQCNLGKGNAFNK